ncbi:hypothetical protein B296_00005635 [Ensete ventricosum]|uniref:NADH:quinone oxidoreductase/Mrp antiporter transmembrane domain-containing protein n=1 Tax=Ensete ventricosum TaxID=4639 RepID=A0A426YH37_ENSVE|nr:hypothetical protein B296_00005635 [Ensete ventricosum]
MEFRVFVRAVCGESCTYGNEGGVQSSSAVWPTHPICSMIYGSTGATHFDQLAKIFTGYEITGAQSSGIFMGILFIAVGFLFKITAVPLRAALGRTAPYRYYRFLAGYVLCSFGRTNALMPQDAYVSWSLGGRKVAMSKVGEGSIPCTGHVAYRISCNTDGNAYYERQGRVLCINRRLHILVRVHKNYTR